MFAGITLMRVASIGILAAASVHGLTTRQSTLTSGFYNIFSISVDGFPIGFIPGFSIGVEASTDPIPSDHNTFSVIQYPKGYILHLCAGNAAAASAGDVTLISSFLGSYWNIVPLDNGLYA
ncbi:hypothetical protein EIP86_011401 [Pleurotus ostreatoroseus]|nr:hypothetical protein EIP86_011401 [Pleurotus ostreatoroseus]